MANYEIIEMLSSAAITSTFGQSPESAIDVSGFRQIDILFDVTNGAGGTQSPTLRVQTAMTRDAVKFTDLPTVLEVSVKDSNKVYAKSTTTFLRYLRLVAAGDWSGSGTANVTSKMIGRE
jgi:hypothetical protein